jgi:hypothetical protein
MNFIKWAGTILIIFATIMRIFEYHFLDLTIGLVGTMLWAYASYVEKEKALLTVNIFIIIVLLIGLIL